MAAVTQPLRDEHRELLPHVDSLRFAADAVGEADAGTLRAAVDAAYGFLSHHLIPHAEAEEAALYPVVARLMGAPEATGTMSRDHLEVRRLTEQLEPLRDAVRAGTLSPAQERDLRAVLYGLYALVKVHFAKEEEVYLPLLDERLPASEAAAMFEAMEAAAGAAKAVAAGQLCVRITMPQTARGRCRCHESETHSPDLPEDAGGRLVVTPTQEVSGRHDNRQRRTDG